MRVSTSEPSLNRLNLDYRELDARALELHRKLLAGGAQEREWWEQYLRPAGNAERKEMSAPRCKKDLVCTLKRSDDAETE